MSLGNLYDNGVTIYRELAARDDTVLVIDCVKRFTESLRREMILFW